MSTLPAFRKQLAAAAEKQGVSVDTWSAGGRSSGNLLELSTAPKATVLYVKEFNTAGHAGFWGLTRNQVNRLEKANARWFAVLLLRSSAAGYVLTAADVRRSISDTSFELSRDGDYKVNEQPDLRPAQAFQSVAELFERVA
ncbi:MAG: hypothetical protein IT530_04740 [Burkholderiales bacterium]|nr:hypothetical protein [Burkholderiales bacterium]